MLLYQLIHMFNSLGTNLEQNSHAFASLQIAQFFLKNKIKQYKLQKTVCRKLFTQEFKSRRDNEFGSINVIDKSRT